MLCSKRGNQNTPGTFHTWNIMGNFMRPFGRNRRMETVHAIGSDGTGARHMYVEIAFTDVICDFIPEVKQGSPP